MIEAQGVQSSALGRSSTEAERGIEALTQSSLESGVRTDGVTAAAAEREQGIAALTQTVRERDARLAALAGQIAQKDAGIAALERAIRQRDLIIQQVGVAAVQANHRLRQARASLGYRFLAPIRMMTRLVAHLSGRIRIEPIPFNEIQADDAMWQATGGDPQFLLIAEREWSGLTGWGWLEFEATCTTPMSAQLYFDSGEGFNSSGFIQFQIRGSGRQRIPICVPLNCRAIRLDPCDAPARFGLVVRGFRRLERAPELEAEFLAQSSVYDLLSTRRSNVGALEPVQQVRRYGAGYYWRSEGADPWFLVKGLARGLRPGWYSIEACIHAEVERGNAKLYFDHGSGYSESDTVVLPYRSEERTSRLYRLAAAPREVRFDPLETAASFSVERLEFRPSMPIFARNSMLRRLCKCSAQYNGQRIGRVWRDLRVEAEAKGIAAFELLYERYNESFLAHGAAIAYAEWIVNCETPEFSDAAAIKAARRSFRQCPTVSVLMPVYNTEERFLRRAIESVLAQSYPHWELCIADDASTRPHVRAVLEEYARRDSRVKTVFRPENGHISAASNSALALASGEFIALLDHDDELAPHALHFAVATIDRNPSAQILYSDEDKIDETGERSEPHFKPEWNPDLFLSQNYVSHLGVYRRDLVECIGGFRTGVEGSQDHDLLLRCLRHVAAVDIMHIPKVLYHWRSVEGSTAFDGDEKRYAAEAGLKALTDFFMAQGRSDVSVEPGLAPNTYRICYPVPRPEPLVSLLIPTRDKVELLAACVRSILEKTTYRNFEILILDNGSAEAATLEYLRRIQFEDARVRVLPYHHAFNFSAINNFGVREARGEVVGLVNNDIEVITAEWLTEMVSHALRPEVGCVGAKLYYADDTIQHAGVIVGLGGVAGHSHKYFPREASGYFHRLKVVQNLSAVTAACLVVRKAVYEEVGGLDEAGLGVAFNDVDFCLKVRNAGYRNLWTPYAELYHYESKSRGTEDSPDKIKRFNSEIDFIKRKWGELLQDDPCYSRNLTLAREDFSLR